MSPKSSKQLEEIKEKKRNLIMDHALRLFAENGFQATRIDQIAKHCGVSKGLIYNYFASKEELLKEIINRSLTEVYQYFDINRDGYLTEDEFEYFIRQVFRILKEKRTFWQLFFQLLMQKEVREEFINHSVTPPDINSGEPDVIQNLENYVLNVLSDYFRKKTEKSADGYDPLSELILFAIALKGLTITYLFSDEKTSIFDFEKIVDLIIEKYK